MNQTKNDLHKIYFDNFLKNSIQLIIDSRKITKNTNQKLTFIEDMNDNNNKSLFFEDLSFDTLNSFNHSKQSKNITQLIFMVIKIICLNYYWKDGNFLLLKKINLKVNYIIKKNCSH